MIVGYIAGSGLLVLRVFGSRASGWGCAWESTLRDRVNSGKGVMQVIRDCGRSTFIIEEL